MRKLLLIIGLLISVIAQAQRTRYIILDSLLGPPADTFRVPTQYRNLPFLAARHDSVYIWDKDAHYWKPVGGGGGSTELGDQGLSKSLTNIQLGQLRGTVGDPALISSRREIPTLVDSVFAGLKIKQQGLQNGVELAGFGFIQIHNSAGSAINMSFGNGAGAANTSISFYKGANPIGAGTSPTLEASSGYHWTGINVGGHHFLTDMRDSTGYASIESFGLSEWNFISGFNGGGHVTQGALRGKFVLGAALDHTLINGWFDNTKSTYLRDSLTLKYTPFGTVDSVLAKDANDLVIAVPVSSISSNIGNSDLTLSGNRVLSGNSKTLNFDSLGSFWANTKTLSNQQGTIYFNESQSLIESRDNSTHKAGSVETGAQGTVQLTSSLNAAARNRIALSQDSVNITYTTAPSSASLTGYKLQARNTSSGAFVDFTGTMGTVTSVAAGYGTTFSTITSTGSVIIDSTVIADKTAITNISGNWKFTGSPTFGNTITPIISDGAALGTTSLQWSDLFLASGGVINFANGNVSITHSSGILDVSGLLRTTGSNDIRAGGSLVSSGQVVSNLTGASANFWTTASSGLSGSITQAEDLFGGASTVQARVVSRGSSAGAPGAGNSYSNVILGSQATTEASSGTHGLMASLVIVPNTYTGAAGATTDLTNFYIKGPPTGLATTNPITSLWVDAGIVRVDDSLSVGVGTAAPNSALQTTSFSTAYRALTALRTLDVTDNVIEVTANSFTVTLPTAVGITGREYTITNSGAGTVTLGTTSSQTFANVTATPTTLTLAQFNTVKVISNGANWLRVTSL